MNLSIRLARLCKHLCAPNIYHQQVMKEKLCWYNRKNFFVFASSWFDWFSSSWL